MLVAKPYVSFHRDGRDFWNLREGWEWGEAPVGMVIARLRGERVACLRLFKRTVHIPGAQLPALGVGGVYTKEAFRGRGVASILLQKSIERLRGAGHRILLLNSGKRSLYARAGFVEIREGLWAHQIEGIPFWLQPDWEVIPKAHF